MSQFEQPTLDDVREALSFVDPHDRDTWVNMGFAVRSEFYDSGFELWDSWSQGAQNYSAGAAKATWKSCKASGASGGITIASLFHAAKQNGWVRRKVERAPEQRAEAEAQREQWKAEQVKLHAAEQARIERMQLVVSRNAEKIWSSLDVSGTSPYLVKKKVRAYGLRFLSWGMVIVTDVDAETVEIITGKEAISQFFNRRTEETSFLYLKPGVVAMPLCDWNGTLWNIQFIFQDGAKKFMKAGRKQGCFHLFGELTPRSPLCVTEGYATGASIHEATGYPVAITLDCGNLKPVAVELRRQLDDQPMLICGDDDVDTKGNPGRTKALEAAKLVQAQVVFPVFARTA